MTDRITASTCQRPSDLLVELQHHYVVVSLVVTKGILVHLHGEDIPNLGNTLSCGSPTDHA